MKYKVFDLLPKLSYKQVKAGLVFSDKLNIFNFRVPGECVRKIRPSSIKPALLNKRIPYGYIIILSNGTYSNLNLQYL